MIYYNYSFHLTDLGFLTILYRVIEKIYRSLEERDTERKVNVE
jgi:hypothetical protein